MGFKPHPDVTCTCICNIFTQYLKEMPKFKESDVPQKHNNGNFFPHHDKYNSSSYTWFPWG